MLFSKIAAAAFVPLAFASPLVKRQASDNSAKVLADIDTVVEDIGKLNNTLNRFKVCVMTRTPSHSSSPQGVSANVTQPDSILGFATALIIQGQTKQLGDDLQATTADVDASTPFTADESNAVASAVLNLQPQIQSLLTNIVAHKPAFATAVFFVGDLSKTVQGDLEDQRAFAGDFGRAVQAKLASPYSDFAPLITAQILGYFDDAISKYQTCSGILCLPDISGIPK